MSILVNDVRYALRTLAHNPGFTSIAVVALALGIGANTAIFSVVNGVLLAPLPYHDPGRLVRLGESSPDFSSMSVSYPDFKDWRERSTSFSSMAAIRWEDYDVTGGGQPEHLNGRMVSAEFFPVLGIHPVLGRDFDTREDRLGTTPVAIISGGLWKRRFGADRGVIGRKMKLNGADYTIVGVVPANFEYQGQYDLYTLIGQWDDPIARARDMHPGLYVVARLKPGVTLARAQSEMTAVASRLAEIYPKSNAKHGVNLTPLAQVLVGDVGSTLLVLMGAVGFVLLIACANVANLLLARSTGRRREMAIRTALGASRGRVMLQLMTESLVLSLAGGVAGLGIAAWGTRAVTAAIPGGLPRMGNIAMDGWVLAFTLGVSLITGAIFGLAPALESSSTRVHETLKEGSRGSTAGPHRLRSLLVISEVSAALVLLIGAGLMLRTMRQLASVKPGFDADKILTFSAGMAPEDTASSDRILESFDRTLGQIRAVPGVADASLTTLIPMGGNDNEIPFFVTGRPRPTSQGDMNWALMYTTGPDYLKSMGIPLLRGRYLARSDSRGAPMAVAIDEVVARTVFHGEDPIGKSISIPLGGELGPDPTMEIVGVVAHVNHWGLDKDGTARVRGEVYTAIAQLPEPFMKEMATGASFVVRAAGDPRTIAADVRRAVVGTGSGQPIYDVRTMNEIVSASVAGRRFSMLLLGIFAALALALAAVGIYGVISYTVAQRTHEIGIRMALGASAASVWRAVAAESMMPVLAGVGTGLALALALTRLMAHMLYGVKASDPATFGAVAVVLCAVAAGASIVPARRATRVDPVTALRHD
ncbi:MAG TPA: ABC transporter permease [Bryobacteraceae bacterium]|nr:ABC transporter permease [Bryobacteraceae bacterium]